MRLRPIAVLALSAALLLVLTPVRGRPAPVRAAETWTVQVGGDIAAESIAANAFFPGHLTVNVGDTVNWVWRGFHTVTFNAGQPPLNLIIPGPEPGELQLGPALFNYPPGPTPPSGPYDGTRQISAGVPLEGAEDYVFSLTFTQTGIFPYVCTVHPGMQGSIQVLPAGAPLAETPAQAQARGQTEMQEALIGLKTAILPGVQEVRTPGPGGVTIHSLAAGVSLASGMSALQFIPNELHVRRGDVVVWSAADPFEIHTVTFLSGAPTPAEIEVRPQAGGPPLVVFPARVAGPVGGTTYTGQGYLNSGIFGAGGSFALTIDAPPGTYEYICLIHSGAVAEASGAPPMKGRIVVE